MRVEGRRPKATRSHGRPSSRLADVVAVLGQ